MLWTLLGLACVAYTASELARAFGPARDAATRTPRFGAVDASTGRALEVTFDRRTRGRRTRDS